jgi:hypothetical protein
MLIRLYGRTSIPAPIDIMMDTKRLFSPASQEINCVHSCAAAIHTVLIVVERAK